MSEPDTETRPDGGAPAPEQDSSRWSGHRVHAGTFDGPLDLLLHLVRVNEVEIADIPIVTITDQYNEYLQLMRDLDLEVAGEFILMAATLMHIKSRMLLPPDPRDEEEEGEADPRAELAQQLLEYQRFKQAAENLEAMDSRRQLIWTRDVVDEEFADEELLAVEMVDLLKAFKKLLGRLGEEARVRLQRDNVSVAEKIAWLGDTLELRRSVELGALFEELPTRLDRIATFLALLEMVRLQLVLVFQRKALGEIRIVKTDPADAPADVASAADDIDDDIDEEAQS
jgi:segregation and condensation protein A